MTRKQGLVAVFIAGWLGALTIIAVGDYQMKNRLPTVQELGSYALSAIFAGPLLALIALWMIGYFKKDKN